LEANVRQSNLDIYRCPKCRTAVWSDYGHKVDLRFVRVSTLDEPGILKPDATLFGWLWPKSL
jgi:Zn-finger nucleic acid-binding protein